MYSYKKNEKCRCECCLDVKWFAIYTLILKKERSRQIEDKIRKKILKRIVEYI